MIFFVRGFSFHKIKTAEFAEIYRRVVCGGSVPLGVCLFYFFRVEGLRRLRESDAVSVNGSAVEINAVRRGDDGHGAAVLFRLFKADFCKRFRQKGARAVVNGNGSTAGGQGVKPV